MQELHVMNGKFRHMPRHHWKNDYPIVLVHGYFGYVPDSCWFFEKRNYFQFALEKNVAQRSVSMGANHLGHNIYIASLSPIGGIHDRACELYQQLVGITKIKKKVGLERGDNGPNLVKTIYGPAHCEKEHQQQRLYKPRYLRQIRGGNQKQHYFAFPDGLPGGWNSI